MSKGLTTLLQDFSSGRVPTGDNFRDLIEASFNNNVEIYTSTGVETKKVKMFVGNTTVKNNNGEWDIDFSNVGYTKVLAVQSDPIQSSAPTTPYNTFLSSVVYNFDKDKASGVSFNSGVVYYANNDPGNARASIGTVVQILVIGY